MSSYSKSVGSHTFLMWRSSLFTLQKSFRTGTSTRLDDRVFSMCQLKYHPLAYSMLMIHPSLYRVDDLTDEVRKSVCYDKPIFYFFKLALWSLFLSPIYFALNCQGALNINERTIPQPRLLQLSVEKLSREGAFLMDAGTVWCFYYCYHLYWYMLVFMVDTCFVFFFFLKGDLFVDWAELQSYLPHASSRSSQLCCCAWQPGKKACTVTIILTIKHCLNLLIVFFLTCFASKL